MTNSLAIDTENNTWNTGAPFDGRFKGVCHSWATDEGAGAAKNDPAGLDAFAERIRQADCLVGFNIKYDLHVLRKIGVPFEGKRVWDCQLAEFIRSNQQWKYPSLKESCEKYGLPAKGGDILETYWKNGVQTEDIPWPELSEYATQDSRITFLLYQNQVTAMTPSQMRLCRLMSADLLVLEEMEWNGIKFDEELAYQRTGEIRSQVQEIEKRLLEIYPNVPISFNSGDQLSAFLYGGTIKQEVKEHVGFFKTGAKIGQPRFRNHEVLHELPRLFTPVRNTELKKPGFWQTSSDVLLKLRGNKKTKDILELIQRRTRLSTLLEKTYEGLIKVHTEQNWEPNYLHGQFNQVTVTTGRLSSSKPNLQNLDGEAQDLFISRYNE
jgi:DNA polymerase I-like protein with 3'-5' exonuclease and polymerase domains